MQNIFFNNTDIKYRLSSHVVPLFDTCMMMYCFYFQSPVTVAGV